MRLTWETLSTLRKSVPVPLHPMNLTLTSLESSLDLHDENTTNKLLTKCAESFFSGRKRIFKITI